MPRKMIQRIGPTPDRILFKMSKEGFNAIKDPIKEAGIDVKSRARDIASGFQITGDYKRSIGRTLRARKREGKISVKVGIKYRSDAMVYARKVEAKHNVFTRLEYEFKHPVTSAVRKGIKIGLRSLRIR